jgi:phosphoribosylglycinamide formyltransferase-1
MLRIVTLVSGGGTNLQAVIDAVENGTIKDAQIVKVISNKADAYALERAAKHGIGAQAVVKKDFPDREALTMR